MEAFRPPVADILEALDIVGLGDLATAGGTPVDLDLVRDLIGGFATFVAEVVAPLDRPGDLEGSRHDPATGAVTTPAGFKSAYEQYVSGGWGGISVPTEHGGGGFPVLVGIATDELLSAANLSFSLNPLLTRGAIELLSAWGSPQQHEQYLSKMVTGEWTGTMNLTEPDAGSDVGALRSKAVPADDGTWRVSGSKIFITFGEHDLADNIVHLVLARTPGSPAGTKGISLFVVPKVLPDGTRNAVRCVSIEHKLGIHASPTCVLEYDDAVGELVGPEHGGMRAMFTMMNAARLNVAVQGIAIGEPAYQQALAYARERVQGGGPIINHPDVARMLMDMRSSIRAMRLLVYTLARETDDSRYATDPDERARSQRLVDLLTPIAKGWCTDTGVRLASLGVQIHGGMGFIEETGIAQRYRDARIAPIYEGTNGIQAIDLAVRKTQGDKGAAMAELVQLIEASGLSGPARVLQEVTDWIVAQPLNGPDVLAGATALLELCGLTVAGWLLMKRADAVGSDEAIGDATFFAHEHLTKLTGLAQTVMAGAGRLSSLR